MEGPYLQQGTGCFWFWNLNSPQAWNFKSDASLHYWLHTVWVRSTEFFPSRLSVFSSLITQFDDELLECLDGTCSTCCLQWKLIHLCWMIVASSFSFHNRLFGVVYASFWYLCILVAIHFSFYLFSIRSNLIQLSRLPPLRQLIYTLFVSNVVLSSNITNSPYLIMQKDSL